MAKVKVILKGKSWGAQNGDERMVEEERAAEMVANNLADYSPHSKAAKKAD